ncbi:polymorphic toxin type 46 domain-containing protein, partial [Planctomicrobium sp.]
SELNQKNMKTTMKFMEQNGASQREIQDFAKGTDFSQSVEVENAPVGKSLMQRVHQGDPQEIKDPKLKNKEPDPGRYYSDQGVAASRAGISDENRKHQRFETIKEFKVLRSKSASISDSWSNEKKRQPTRGGNTQYWVPKDKQQYVKPVSPRHHVQPPRKTTPAKRAVQKSKPAPKAAAPKRSAKKSPPPQRPDPQPKKVIKRKGAASDIAVKNGRGIKVPNKQIKSPKPKLK